MNGLRPLRAARLLENLRFFIMNGIMIPHRPGAVYDVLSFLIGLLASLFPAWIPRMEQPPVPVAPPAAVPDDNNNGNNQQPQQQQHDLGVNEEKRDNDEQNGQGQQQQNQPQRPLPPVPQEQYQQQL
jgi:hypothetical protein